MRFILSILTATLGAAGLCAQDSAVLEGTVRSGNNPIGNATVTLYKAGNDKGAAAVALGSGTTGASGEFRITWHRPASRDVIYLIANAGQSVSLAAVLGTAGHTPSSVIVNEPATVASAWSMAQFMNGDTIAGTSPGLQNAAATVAKLVNLSTGEPGAVLANPPNGSQTTTLAEFNTLANLLAACVQAKTTSACNELFSLATPAGAASPANTLQAALNIARNPAGNVAALYRLSRTNRQYSPALTLRPDAWTIAIKYVGNGREFDGPGNLALDKDGNIWSTNNFMYNVSSPFNPKKPWNWTAPGPYLIELTPAGGDAPGAPFSGGGVYGAGYGIAIDPTGDIWVGDFIGGNVSKFNPSGVAQSPNSTGFQQGNLSKPQGMASDPCGTIWIANNGNSTVTKYPLGDPNRAVNFTNIGLSSPFGLVIDRQGSVWIASSGNNQVVKLRPNGVPAAGSPFTGGGLNNPLAMAMDSLGNVWVTNFPGFIRGSVTELHSDGKPAGPFRGGGIHGPWGIAVDGNDNIWVADFGGRHLSELCGARPSNCPAGLHTGDPISTRSGYTSNALMRLTAVQIDSSGNVWVANNWKFNPASPPNPGGDALVEFIGLAAPVKTPLIGPPRQPGDPAPRCVSEPGG